MKTILMALALALASVATTNAQNTNNKQQLRKERKEMTAKIDSMKWQDAIAAVNDTAFTLEADQLVSKSGKTIYVDSNINFIRLKGKKAVVQISPDAARLGANGLGGVTLECNVTSYSAKTDNKGNKILSMNVLGNFLSARIDIFIYKDSNKASATVTPNLNPASVTLNGSLLPNRFSNVFKGTTR